jgi:hypothetical protein
MQLNAKVTGLEGLDAAIAATEDATKKTAGALVIAGTFQFVRSARAATPRPKFRNRSPHKFGKNTAFYMVRSHKRPNFRAFFPTNNTKKAVATRKAVQKKYKKIRGYGFAKVSWFKMFGDIADAVASKARLPNSPKATQLDMFGGESHKPEKYVYAKARGFRLANPQITIGNKVEYMQTISPNLVETASRNAALSMLRSRAATAGLKSALQKQWGMVK